MVKYIFIKPYTITTPELTSKDGVKTPAATIASFKPGDIVSGELKSNESGVFNANVAKWIEITINGKVYSVSETMVEQYVSKSIFSTNNIVIGIVILGSVYVLLKWKKMI